MRILVDADACPVKEIILNHAMKRKSELFMYIDTSHVYDDGYSKVIMVDKGFDSADFKIMNDCTRGDLVVTQDYGLASNVLGKGCIVINQNGMQYTNHNIDQLLAKRDMNKKIMRSGKRIKGPKKRTKEQDVSFEQTLTRILNTN